MDESEAQIRRAIGRLEVVFPESRGRAWHRRKRDLWVDAVIDLPADAVERGALALVRTWDGKGSPFPGHLRSHALAQRRVPDRRPVGKGTPLDMDAIADQADAQGHAVTAAAIRRALLRVRSAS